MLVTGPAAAGKTTRARPLAGELGLPLIGKDLIKEALDAQLVELFCRCPAAEVERRFAARAPGRHPGHVDHAIGPEMKAALAGGIGPLRLGGPVLEVDTGRPVDVAGVAAWVRGELGQGPGGGPV